MFSFIKKLLGTSPTPKSIVGLQGAALADVLFYNAIIGQKVPGLSVTATRQGEILLQKGYGCSNLENQRPINPSKTLFRIASISKCITGLALGKMVEEGLLDWDDSFYDHVPYFPPKKYDFTLRQLASHTAGIRGYRGKEYALDMPYSIKESLAVFKNDPLLFEPGQGYLYNSFDFVLLSLAMQEACGIPFEAYVREKVLHPLDMYQTFTPRDAVPKDQLARFYTPRTSGFKKAVNVDNFYKLAGGGYISTATDIAKLGEAVLLQQLLCPKTYGQLLQAQRVKGKNTYYGLGFQVSEDAKGRLFYGHVGSSVGAYSNLFVYPNERMVISILVNCTDPKLQSYFDEAINALLEHEALS
ncbi:Beta-lactamase [Croceitalea dokdonensis DOKDO 023]|uniref:Beta-lactamase n=1 Tax=Croceitalea dokdonensis DOKDO 023 TaxID=1300341 RepID=A0A0P7B0G4_9FLAO|nr:serine hydrolase domain-containing protein [Croceitalea dokdonensis]KPM32405.1 Beta-lactamase [Croceitalea dokdonensis DOKDO 023]